LEIQDLRARNLALANGGSLFFFAGKKAAQDTCEHCNADPEDKGTYSGNWQKLPHGRYPG